MALVSNSSMNSLVIIGLMEGSHGCPMYMFKIVILEEEIGVFKAEIQQYGNVLHSHGCPKMQLSVLFQLMPDDGDGRVH